MYLELLLSGENTKSIIPFFVFDKKKFQAMRGELATAGLVLPTKGTPDELIDVCQLPDVKCDYDEQQQRLNLVVPDSYRVKKTFSTAENNSYIKTTPSAIGMFVNYNLYSTGYLDWAQFGASLGGTSLTLIANQFSPIGTFTQGVGLVSNDYRSLLANRLDTSWTYASPRFAWVWQAGDLSTSSVSWSQSIRMGGLQFKKNFGLRPDLVTTALPQLSGSAVLPSAVDVYINDRLLYQRSVGSGPFEIDNLPTFTGPSTIQMKVTDVNGQTRTITRNFWATSQMLKKGLWDYSVEGGFARIGYGTFSFDYDPRPLGSATSRLGLSNRITGETHIEGGAGLIGGGLGAVTNLIPYHLLNLSAEGSYWNSQWGAQLAAGVITQLSIFSINGLVRRDLGNFMTLGQATMSNSLSLNPLVNTIFALSQEQLGLGFALWRLSLSVNGLHSVDRNQLETWNLQGSVSTSLGKFGSIIGNVYGSWAGGNNQFGFNFGLNVPLPFLRTLAPTVSASADSSGQWSGIAQIAKSNSGVPGDYGVQGAYQEGGSFRNIRVRADYTAQKARAAANVGYNNGYSDLGLSLDGGVVMLKDGVFLSNQITDAFALVKTDGAGIEVKARGRSYGITGKSGKLLIPGLTSFSSNRITLDLGDLPVMAQIDNTETVVVPRNLSGVVVEMGKLTILAGAIVTLTDDKGKVLELGSPVLLKGNTEIFMVGNYGMSYVTGLGAKNTLQSFINGQPCEASFDFKPDPSAQQEVGPLVCQVK